MKREIEDRTGRTVTYDFPPKRIISLCPGITETLYALNLENEIAGRTRYCIYPKDKVEQAAVVGGTKQIKLETVVSLMPDLLIAEKEENTKEIVEMAEKQVPVYVAEVQSIDDALRMVRDMGMLTDREERSEELAADIESCLKALPCIKGKRAAYVIWKKPYMVAGANTYISSMLERMGFVNPFTEYEGRYPSITESDFANAELDYIFLASEPYPFKEKHRIEFGKMFPEAKSLILDGEMFWYGPKMLEAPAYLHSCLNGVE